jgi:hypothetical protein
MNNLPLASLRHRLSFSVVLPCWIVMFVKVATELGYRCVSRATTLEFASNHAALLGSGFSTVRVQLTWLMILRDEWPFWFFQTPTSWMSHIISGAHAAKVILSLRCIRLSQASSIIFPLSFRGQKSKVSDVKVDKTAACSPTQSLNKGISIF